MRETYIRVPQCSYLSPLLLMVNSGMLRFNKRDFKSKHVALKPKYLTYILQEIILFQPSALKGLYKFDYVSA